MCIDLHFLLDPHYDGISARLDVVEIWSNDGLQGHRPILMAIMCMLQMLKQLIVLVT